ncbi:glycoside hydrolase [Microthyrium microscopicum]|uniref:non-reducing end alpha-L-arabinofuranosidase n=1 Tax=Microthyrium microscopicum TaxID=703497 RepID=A0A6A6UKZ6_9PEZI|nr:glycoside hydrolase [Microthyrium microscopicum]
MATFTKLSASETPTIQINSKYKISKINDNIYGGFTEHMGRCIYGGIYDPGNNLSDENGYRKDVMEALKELNVPVMRYPGGNFVATYRWEDGIGPREQRPSRPELAWLGTETNQFGTDEFLQWCELLGTEPYFALNFGTGTLLEALAWIEYCNLDGDTHYANLRRKNGRQKPYNVKYWALGNECWGPWQVEQMTKEAYAEKAYQWAKAIKLLDPSVELVLCGQDGTSTWDAYVLKQCIKWNAHALGGSTDKPLISMHSIHIYTSAQEHLPNATAPRSAERAIEITAGLIDLARIENQIPHSVPRPTICFDEWNVWDPTRAPGDKGAEEKYTLSDALAVAVWLNVFIRQSKYIGMANIAQSVNVISPLMTSETGITKQTTWWPLLLFSKYMRGSTIPVNVSCGEYEGPTQPAWIRGTIETPWLDVSAAISDDGWVSLAVVNVSDTDGIEVDLMGAAGTDIQVHTVTGSSTSVFNTQDNQEVRIEESKWDGKGKFLFLKHSFTLLRWKV